ncbi:hypothetical protein F5X99DRAFT_392635 [Biscogniauxia marginata]|nr:hypothetical protein F5X99DRAFT_392635 [Biscogniauxia marginata]
MAATQDSSSPDKPEERERTNIKNRTLTENDNITNISKISQVRNLPLHAFRVMKYRIIRDKNGSILGKIPVNPMSDYHPDRDCHDSSSSSSSSSSSNHRSSTSSERAAILEEIFRDEPDTMSRPSREIQTNAIREYHNHALSTRTAEHTAEVRRHRERRQAEQQPSYESLGSDVGTSESDESSPSSSRRKTNRPKDHFNPKYLVRGFLKSIFRSRSSPSSKAEDDGRRRCSDHESFFPSPKTTFMIDQPNNLVCQICQEAPLKMGISAEEAKGTTPAILPCGHIACQSCLGLWLEANGNCPFCRHDMVYAGCGHNVEPRPIAHDTIHSIPRTLADGGRIGHSCHTCRAKAQREATLEKWLRLAEEFKAARQEAEELKTEEATQAMKKAQKAFERVPFDEAYDTLALSIRTW